MAAFTAEATAPVEHGDPRVKGAGSPCDVLYLALEGQRPLACGARYSLRGVREVAFGRGAMLSAKHEGDRLVGAQVCDEKWNPNLLLYCDQSKSGIPFRTQFKLSGTVPVKYGIQVGVSFQSLPGYRFGTAALAGADGVSGPTGQPSQTQLSTPNGAGSVWLITPTTRYTACPGTSASAGCVVGALVDPGMTVASLSVPLRPPQTEYGDRINQLDLNLSKTIRYGRASFQPKIDFFNLLNVSPVYAVRSLNYGTASYLQPSSILVGRVFQLGAVVKF